MRTHGDMWYFLLLFIIPHAVAGYYPVPPKPYGGYPVPPPKDVTTEAPSPPKFTQGAPPKPALPVNVANELKSIRATGNKISDADMALIKANCQKIGCKGQKPGTQSRRQALFSSLRSQGQNLSHLHQQFVKTLELKKAILQDMGLASLVDAEDDGLFQGNILLSTQQAAEMIKSVKNKTSVSTTLWDNSKVINYAVTSEFVIRQSTMFEAAFREITRQVPCLKFKLNGTERETGYRIKWPGILFRPGVRCTSNLGLQGVGLVNNITVTPDCENEKSIMQLILHTLGIMHTQGREDRDKYITLKYGNIIPMKLPNLAIVDPANHSPFGVNYDFVSFMHFDPRDQSADKQQYAVDTKKPTVVVKPAYAAFDEFTGKASDISPSDVKLLKRMYCTPKTCTDNYPECGVLAIHGLNKIKPWLTNNCKKSMGLC